MMISGVNLFLGSPGGVVFPPREPYRKVDPGELSPDSKQDKKNHKGEEQPPKKPKRPDAVDIET